MVVGILSLKPKNEYLPYEHWIHGWTGPFRIIDGHATVEDDKYSRLVIYSRFR